MRKVGIIAAVALAALIGWAAVVGIGAREGWLRPLPAAKGDTTGFLRWAEDRYHAESKGNFAMALLRHGRVAAQYYASHGRPVDGQSLFQVASMSKWVTAWGVMHLVEQHRLALDVPVERYLTRWHLPPSRYGNQGVTVRRLLSHTAGLTDGLGFLGYRPGQKLPSIEAELTHAQDAMPGRSGITRVGAPPGDSWRYSGGGYLLLQLLIEEVTHQPFNDYMRRAVLRPLGMNESTFVAPDPAHLAEFFNSDGSRAIHYRFTAVAAASLYTSTADMTRFLEAQIAGAQGAPPGRGVLSPATLVLMRRPQAYLYGMKVWGLGESLYAPDGAGSYVIGHDGNNYPAINTTARIDPASGDGIVVLETGNPTLAAEIGAEWVFWKTGLVDLEALVLFDLRALIIAFAAGAVLIVAVAGMAAWRRPSRAAAARAA